MTLTHHFIEAETKIGIQMYQEVRGFIDSVTLNSKQAAILSNWIDGTTGSSKSQNCGLKSSVPVLSFPV
ncbi:14662_t:CDS:2 [Rhizophagus irregularis]|nr:14662_t:CDS:2 [Rhizophagus irregularis]